MEKGSLRNVLDDAAVELSWDMRSGIASGMARGLGYLHSGLFALSPVSLLSFLCFSDPGSCRAARDPPLIHRDVKADNYLVNDLWEAKLADFGTTTIITSGRKIAPSLSVLGSLEGATFVSFFYSCSIFFGSPKK